MINILFNEVYKVFARKKIYIFMAVIGIISIFISISTLATNNMFNSGNLNQSAEMAQNEAFMELGVNGQSFPINLLDSLAGLVLPIMIIILVADIVTSEYTDGSLKLSLLRQVSRAELLLGKVGALALTLMILILYIMLLGYILGAILLGWGNSLMLKGVELSPTYGVMFTLLVYSLSLLPLLSFGMIILLLAVAFSNEGTVVGTGVALLIMLSVANQIFHKLSPFFINNYFNIYNLATSNLGLPHLIFGIFVVLVEGLIFYILSLVVFKRKDILL